MDRTEFSRRWKCIAFFQKNGLNVIPIGKNSKLPIRRFSWKKYQTEKFQNIRGYIGAGYNFAIICGSISENLVVLDFDDMNLYKEYADIKSLTISTARGRRHIYIKCKELPTKCVNYKGMELDIYSNGSYVVAPPSEITIATCGMCGNQWCPATKKCKNCESEEVIWMLGKWDICKNERVMRVNNIYEVIG